MRNLFIISFALLGLIGLSNACKQHPKIVNNDPNAVYICPMHPEITGKTGDKCSKCGMDLEVTAAIAATAITGMTGATGMTAATAVATAVAVASEANNAPAQKAENPLSAVYASYFNLKNALVKDDAAGAQAAAKTLFDDIAAVPMDKLNPEQHTLWMKYQKNLSAGAKSINGSNKIKAQRASFAALSQDMHEVMKVIKNDAPVYYQHCPMYNDGKGGDWLSLDSKISNPLYGKEMMTCGKTMETIQ